MHILNKLEEFPLFTSIKLQNTYILFYLISFTTD